MKTRGHEVLLFCTAGSDLEKKSQQAGIKTANVYKKKTWIQMAVSVMRIVPILSSKQYDIIHAHNPHDLWSIVPALAITKRKDIKLTLTIHLASGINKKDPFHKFLYRRVNKIIALSGFLKENILKTYPVEKIEVTVIPTALTLSEYKPEAYQSGNIKQEFGIRGNCLTVGIIGRLTHGKGHEEFVRAAKRVKEKFKGDIKFVIAGQPDIGEEELEVKLRQLCSELDLHNEVVFTGFQDNIPRLLTALDILAFPSHDEAFGRTIVEAMAMKVPVVASNSSAISEIVVNGKTGILIPPKNSESLANALIGLLRKPELRKRYGEEGRKRVEEKFDAEKTFAEIERIYQEPM